MPTDHNKPSTIGAEIKAALKRLQLNDDQLRSRLGVSRRTYYEYKADRWIPHNTEVIKKAQEMGMVFKRTAPSEAQVFTIRDTMKTFQLTGETTVIFQSAEPGSRSFQIEISSTKLRLVPKEGLKTRSKGLSKDPR